MGVDVPEPGEGDALLAPGAAVAHAGVVYPSELERVYMGRAASFDVERASSLVGTSTAVLVREATKLLRLSGALVVSSLASFLVPVMTLAFVGRNMSKSELSVVALASSFFNVTGYAAIVGSLGALETLISNAHGANSHALKGVLLQRSILITMTMCIAVIVAWTRMYDVMILAGQDPDLARSAADYLLHISPSLVFLAASDAMKKFFTCQSLVVAPTVAALAGTAMTFLYNWVFIVVWKWGLRGAALAVDLAQLTPCIILYTWYTLRERRLREEGCDARTWHGFDFTARGAFGGWGEYFKLAIPSAAMVALEWGVFECSLLLSGWLDDPSLHVAVMGLSLNFSGTVYMLPLGVSSATAVRVGNAIGGCLPDKAKRSAWVSLTLTVAMQVGLGIMSVVGRQAVGMAFSDDEGVIRATAEIVPLIAFCMLGDGVNASIGGMLRGIGRQEIGAKYNLLSYWGVGMPLAYVLAIPLGMGIFGLWTGLATCASLNGVIMFVVLRRVDWHAAVTAASERRR
jgi:MATE family multidrug resistance protein